MVGRVKIRVFTFPSDPHLQNSYVVGTAEGGLLPTVGAVRLEEGEVDTVTFAQLRNRIEVVNDNGMLRRTLMFQEALQIIATSPNPHSWPSSSFQTYWFGYMKHEDDEIPQVIHVTEENNPISKYLDMATSKVTGDLILIPQTQLGPVCEKCCQRTKCQLCP